MNDRPTPETDAVKFQIGDSNHFAVHVVHARRLERERDEAREWQTFLSGWGGTPEIVNDFIKGQQMRIYAAQEAERERDEAREAAEKAKAYKRVLKEDNAKLRRENDELNKRLIEVCQYGVVCTIEREDIRKEVAAERALADRLANAVACLSAETTQGYEHIQSVFDAWKEARK